MPDAGVLDSIHISVHRTNCHYLMSSSHKSVHKIQTEIEEIPGSIGKYRNAH